MDAKLVSNYLSKLKEKSGLTYEEIAERSQRSVSTVKNLAFGKSEDPRLATVAPVIYAAGGSLDEMYTGKSRCNEFENNNDRNRCEKHLQDVKENYEKRLNDKREIIEQKDQHIETLKKENRSSKIFSWICVAILVALLIAEVMNPNLGWLRY